MLARDFHKRDSLNVPDSIIIDHFLCTSASELNLIYRKRWSMTRYFDYNLKANNAAKKRIGFRGFFWLLRNCFVIEEKNYQ